MKLTKTDREILRADFKETEDALAVMEKALASISFTYKGKRISEETARALLPVNQFYSGLDRAVWHWDAVRFTHLDETGSVIDGYEDDYVVFDTCSYWRQLYY